MIKYINNLLIGTTTTSPYIYSSIKINKLFNDVMFLHYLSVITVTIN